MANNSKEIVKLEDGRVFKLCDDVLLAVKEKRKLFWLKNGKAFELRCVSENMGPEKYLLFLYDQGGGLGEADLYHYRESTHGSSVYFDVTPEKRYAIWDKRMGRFATLNAYRHRTDVFADWHIASRFTVVEFDNPDQEK